MRKALFIALTGLIFGVVSGLSPASAASPGRYEVFGVGEDDMLKLRAGPGTGYIVIVGLPNGTELQVHECQQTGSTRWCEVSMVRARSLRGFVSWAYLRKK